ncbi:MAG: RNA polymerase sigma factor [bacterium]
MGCGKVAESDEELVRRCQRDRAAFEELLRRYRRAIFAYAVAATGSRQDAEEVTQDTFVKVFRAAHRFNPKYRFTTWLYTIAGNTCKNKYRRRRKRKGNVSLDNEDIPVAPVSHQPTPPEVYRRNVEIEEVRDAIDELPPRYREVLYLRYVEGLSYKEIANALGLSLGNVEARIFRGKDKVRRKLLASEGEGMGTWTKGPGED